MRTEDGSIVQECLDGEPGAFGILVDKYKAGIYAFVYDKLRDFHDAQDITQEVFEHAYRGLRSLRYRERFAFWLYRIARNRCRKWIRTQSRRPDRDFAEDQDPAIFRSASMDSYRDGQLDQSLREALDALSEAYHEVLVLHYFGGMSSKEIAGAIGTSPGAVRARLTRARAQLRKEMLAMMDTAFEGQKLHVSFTFRIVEAVKRIKIPPTPRAAGLPWGLSFAIGIMVAVLSLNPHVSMPGDTAALTDSSLPAETRVLKAGEIPVDILKVSQIPAIASKQANGAEGKPHLQKPQNAQMLASRREDGQWTEKADMLTPRSAHCAAAVNGKIYAIGGGPEETDVEEYDPLTDTWTKRADAPEPKGICWASASVVNDKIPLM